MRAIRAHYSIGAQVAATLACATFATFHLASETDTVVTYRAARHMLGAGALTAGPTALPALGTVGLAAVGAIGDATFSADNFMARATLADAFITTDVPVAIQSHNIGLQVAGMARWALDDTCIAIAGDMYGCLAFAVTEVDFRHRHRGLDDRIGVERDLDTQPVVFDLFGNLAVQICF
jgi:hypothetical protein